MKFLLAVIIATFFVAGINIAHASIITTSFDVKISSKDIFEPTPNKHVLVMMPGDSQKVTIQITNNDSKPHTIGLQMENRAPRPERTFVIEPSQLEIEAGKTASSIITVSVSPDASTGTTVFHRFVAKSDSFGTKGAGFYLKVSERIEPPSPDPPRRTSIATLFPPGTILGVPESQVSEMLPSEISLPSYLPQGYSLQGFSDTQRVSGFYYSDMPVTRNTTPPPP